MAISQTQKYAKMQGKPRKQGRPAAAEKTHPDLENKLLQAALEVFGAKGFDGASLSQIAGLAQADIALIRYYFGSKQGLWLTALDRLSLQLAGELETVLAKEETSNETDKLKAAIRWFIGMSAKYPFVSRIIAQEGSDQGERGAYIANDFISPFYEVVSLLIEGAKREGTIPDVSTRTVFFMITHGGSFPMAMPALTNAFPGGKIASKQALSAHCDAIISLIMRNRSENQL